VALGVPPSGRSHFSRRENVPNDSYFPSCRDSLGRGSNLQGWRRKGSQEQIEPGLIVAVVRFGLVPVRVRVASRR